MDLGGLLGLSCADLQVSPISIGWSSCPGCKGVRLDLYQVSHDGFTWTEDGVHGGGASGSGRARASGGHFVFLNNQQVGCICWALGPAGM